MGKILSFDPARIMTGIFIVCLYYFGKIDMWTTLAILSTQVSLRMRWRV